VVFDADYERKNATEVRAPRKTVKVMRQDWVSTLPKVDVSMSVHRATTDADSSPHAPDWKKSGEPYEREFEV
jgi:hypothetical protein